MKYVITFSSMSGNTAALAGRLHDLLPAESCVYFGDHSQEVAQLDADLFLSASGPTGEAATIRHAYS